MSFWGAIGSIIPGISDIINYTNQEDEKKYDRQQAQLMRDREDNAVQRRVNDLKLAGLSPTLAAGSPAEAKGSGGSAIPQGNDFFTSAEHVMSLIQGAANVTNINAGTLNTRMQTANTGYNLAWARKRRLTTHDGASDLDYVFGEGSLYSNMAKQILVDAYAHLKDNAKYRFRKHGGKYNPLKDSSSSVPDIFSMK
jgi:hypothetical protein